MNEMMTMVTFMLSKVPKLNAHNYNQWKVDMELRLKSAQLWSIVAEARPARTNDDWLKKEALVLTDIRQHCDTDVKTLIADLRNAKSAWDTLKTAFQQDTDENKNRLLGDFNITMKESEKMQEYISRMKTIVIKLKDLGEAVPDGRIVDRLVHGMSNTKLYSDLSRTLRVQRLTLEDCQSLLLREEHLRTEEQTHQPTSFANQEWRRCNSCGRRGHLEPDRRPGPVRDRDFTNRRPNNWPYDNQRRDYNRDYNGRRDYEQRRDNDSFRRDSDRSQQNRYPQQAHMAQQSGYEDRDRHYMDRDRDRHFNDRDRDRPYNDRDRSQFDYPVAPHAPPDFDHFAQMAILEENDSSWESTHKTAKNELLEAFSRMSPPLTAAAKHSWLVDSGATNHYTARRDLLESFNTLPEPIPILTGPGYIYAYGIGNIRVRLSLGEVIIDNVLWLPRLAGHASLLSVPQLTRGNCKVVFEENTCDIFSNNQLIARASYRGRAYYLDEEELAPHTLFLTISTPDVQKETSYNLSAYTWIASDHFNMMHGSTYTQTINIWHKRLGHLHNDAIRQLTKMATEINIGSKHNTTTCTACLQSSQHRQISHVPRIPADNKLEIVHIDVKGPCDVDVNGFRYWANFMCEKTRFNRGYAMVRKSDLFKAYLSFEAISERESGCRVISLMLDGGGENLTRE